MTLTWINFFHIYQPPGWDPRIIRRVVDESYRPVLGILKRYPDVRVTINVNASLAEQLDDQGYHDVLDDIVTLVERNQLVLTGSAKYHPILPLLPKDEIIRQITLNTKRNKELFGDAYQPSGFFPPEMAISGELGQIVKELGFLWMMADEIALMGTIGDVHFDRKYHIRDVGLPIVFRQRGISDLFFSEFMNTADDFFRAVEKDVQINNVLITAFDGENLGHHRKGFDRVWESIVTDDRIEAITVPEFLKRTKTIEEIVPRASSWSSNPREIDAGIPYVLWHHPENPIHQRQWELTHLAVEAVRDAPSINPKIRSALDEALASDQYWWASAQPWWSGDIIRRGSDRFVSILDNAPGLSDKKRKRATELINEIRHLTRDWQESGKVEKIRHAYLNGDSRPRYLGGEKIS